VAGAEESRKVKMDIDKRSRLLRDELVKLTGQLIAIPTINPPGENYEVIVKLLEQRCKRLGLATRRYQVPVHELKKHGIPTKYPRTNLLARWNTGGKRTLHIHSHYDVVPVTSFWKTDPFHPVVKNGRLYGRGSADMKGNIAAALTALKILKELGIKPKVNIELSFTPDEETGGKLGFKYLVDKGILKPDYVMDEGHYGNKVSYGNKGLLWLKIEVIGKASHAAYAFRGVNAFEYTADLVQELKKLKKKVEKRRTRHGVMEAEEKRPTFVIGGLLKGGNKTNTVPDRVLFSIDRRILPDEDFDTARKEIVDVVHKFKKMNRQIKIKLTVSGYDRPVVVNRNSHLCRTFSRCIRKVYKKDAQFKLLAGGTDMRHLLFKGVPGIGYSVSGENYHSDNEFVYIKSLVDTTRIFAHMISVQK